MSQISHKLSLCKCINVRSSIDPSIVNDDTYKNSGFFHEGKLVWIAIDSILRVLSVESGAEVAFYNFAEHHSARGCVIKCVEEVQYLAGTCILAVGVEFTTGVGGAGMLSIFSVIGSKLIGSMDICEHITCLRFVSGDLARGVLTDFRGIVIVGTEQGKLFFVDLMLPETAKDFSQLPSYDAEIFQMINAKVEDNMTQIETSHKNAVKNYYEGEKCFFTLQLTNLLADPGSITSILAMPNSLLLAVGHDDGRIILYDLVGLSGFHIAHPPCNRSPVTHMAYIEPIHDPRYNVYLLALHSTKEGTIGVLHAITFEEYVHGIYDQFRSCSVRLTIKCGMKDSKPISCISISKPVKPEDEDDDMLKIFLLSWTTPVTKKTFVMVFDLNQWYKEHMPDYGNWQNTNLKYANVFEISSTTKDVNCDEKKFLPFNSFDRPEEHFLPTSLSFHLNFLENHQFSEYNWCGIQALILEKFRTIGPMMILEPSFYFNKMIQATIIPQFYDVNFNMSTPINLQREFLLSVALEYNYVDFLNRCAWVWSDGAMLGKEGSNGVGLSTLTDWIWNRTLIIKEMSNRLSKPLFDYSSKRIDCGLQKQLASCYRQINVLSDLFHTILNDYQQSIPEEIHFKLQQQAATIRVAAEYQEVLQWLLNVGLLPEGHYNSHKQELTGDEEFIIVPYPYRAIDSHYVAQRAKLDVPEDYERTEIVNPKCLFIDAFIANECGGSKLEETWGTSYPPNSIQALLRTLLLEDVSIENKCVVFIYLFMDISHVLHNTPYSSIVQNLIKFPTVFKINPAIIKRTQAFWNMDNGNLNIAVDEIISPLANDLSLPQWSRELLLSVLLKHSANALALKALRGPGGAIPPSLEVAVLLANGLVSEALVSQRKVGSRKLLEKFFEKVLVSPNHSDLLDLTYTEGETKIFRQYLDSGEHPTRAETKFVYLLQRSKFTEAAEFVDKVDKSEAGFNLEVPKQILTSYYSMMEPTTRKLTVISSNAVNNGLQSAQNPDSFGNNLIRNPCKTSNEIYQRCVQSISQAMYESSTSTNNVEDLWKDMPFVGPPKLGIFEYRQPPPPCPQNVIYPNDINNLGKRRLVNNPIIEGPATKFRRIRKMSDEIISDNKFKSFVDSRIQTLTKFRDSNPRLQKRPGTSRATSKSSISKTDTSKPQQNPFVEVLFTPFVKELTPPKNKVPEKCPPTPHSILKTRSMRGSVSPAHSRFSEFDDNKSVKSITFAAVPSTRESSIAHDSSYLEESFNGAQEQMDSSTENFFSPEKSPPKNHSGIQATSTQIAFDGPKPRRPLSRSLTPQDVESKDTDAQPNNDVVMEEENPPAEKSSILNVTSVSYSSNIFQRKSILKSSSEEGNNESENEAEQKSIYGFVRKSVLRNSSEFSDTSESEKNSADQDNDDEDIAEDEHFEEEELPEHSDYDDDDEDMSDDYAVNLDTTSSNSSDGMNVQKPAMKTQNVVIEIDDSDDEVIETVPVTIPITSNILPPFAAVQDTPMEEIQEATDFIELKNHEIVDGEVMQSEDQMIELLYENINENAGEQENIQQIEEVKTDTSAQDSDLMVTAEEIESQTSNAHQTNIKENQTQFMIYDDELDQAVIFDKESAVEESQAQDEIVKKVPVDDTIIATSEMDEEEEVESPPFEEISPKTPQGEKEEGQFELVPPEEENKSAQSPPMPVEENTSHNADLDSAKILTDSQVETSTVSEVPPSEDISFVSATGDNEMNEAAILSNIEDSGAETVFTSPMTKEEEVVPQKEEEVVPQKDKSLRDEDDEEIEEILKNADTGKALSATKVDEKISAVNLTTPMKKTRSSSRLKSKTPDTSAKRAISVPISTTSGTSSTRAHSRSSRASSELRLNPKAILKEKILERIEESPIPEGRITRKKAQMLQQSRETTPVTPNQSRAPSEDIDSPKTATRRRSTATPVGGTPTRLTPVRTPSRMSTRAFSRESLASEKTTPEDPKRPSSRRGQKKISESTSVEEMHASSVESQSTSQEIGDYNRRLTRGQQAMLEKQALSKPQKEEREYIPMPVRGANVVFDDTDSEEESWFTDTSSHASRKRKTDNADQSSIASKSSRKSNSPVKKQQLSMIPEEKTEELSTSAIRSLRASSRKK